jgi:hypothetical protein
MLWIEGTNSYELAARFGSGLPRSIWQRMGDIDDSPAAPGVNTSSRGVRTVASRYMCTAIVVVTSLILEKD